MSLPKLNLITNTQNRIREHISLCTRVPHTIQHIIDFTFSLFIVQSVAHWTKAGIVFSCNVIYHQWSIYDHNLTYSQANHSISMPTDACNLFFIHIMATGNTETIAEYRSWHTQQVCIQLPTYTDSVALPAFTCCCCSNRSIYPVCRAHSSKPAVAGWMWAVLGLLLWVQADRDMWMDRHHTML